ncbi:MAG TPA: CHAD domain-containing protein [Bacteroidales bacterium]|nr:CHAD domain-containing protein [Bacteroidales bacterium]
MKITRTELVKFTLMEPASDRVREIKPVLSAYITGALTLLKRDAVPDEEAVHDVRVLMKKCRSIMKLVSFQVKPEVFKNEYLIFRDTGRALTAFRESSVHRKTLRNLKKIHRELFARLEGNEKIAALLTAKEPHMTPSQEVIASLGETIKILTRTSFRVRFMTLNNPSNERLLEGLQKSYETVCADYIMCRNSPKSSSLHRMRKRVKDLLYQLYFFRPLNPSRIKGVEKRLDLIAQNLGLYNDHSQLLDAIGYMDAEVKNADLDELMIVVRNSQDKYLLKVWPVAYRMFCPGQDITGILGIGSLSPGTSDIPHPLLSGENDL